MNPFSILRYTNEIFKSVNANNCLENYIFQNNYLYSKTQ